MLTIVFMIDANPHWRTRIAELERDFDNFRALIPGDEDELVRDLQCADGVVAGRFPVERLNQAPRLQTLFVPFAGVNPFPLAEISSRGIHMANSHGAAPFVAERILGLTLALLGRIAEADRKLRQGDWLRAKAEHFWQSLSDKTVVIMGVGHLGQSAAGLLRPMSHKVIGWGRRKRKDIPEHFDEYLTEKSAALAAADVLILTAPLTPQTEGIIDAAALEQLGQAYIVNIGRAKLIEEEALYKALQGSQLAGLATDVHYVYKRGEDEPIYPSQFPLHELDNVVMTAHSAAHVTAARQANIDGAFANIRRWLADGTLINPVDLSAGY